MPVLKFKNSWKAWPIRMDFTKRKKTFDVVLMNFINIGESVTKLSDNLTGRESDVPWVKYRGFRNIVAHNYFGVNAEEVWKIIHSSIPELKEKVDNILSKG